jgi:nicotinamidase-related amidase
MLWIRGSGGHIQSKYKNYYLNILSEKKKEIVMKYLIFIVSLFLIFSCRSLDEPINIGKYDNPQKALLVIDMQIDYIDEKGKFPIEKSQINNLIENVNNIIAAFNYNNYQIIYFKRKFRKNDIKNIFRNFAAVEGTAGTEIDPRIQIVSDNIFDKFTTSVFSNKLFEDFLISNRINELYLCGVMADQCVYETALSAYNKGYIVNYFSNAVGSLNVKNIENAIRKLNKRGVNIIEY